MYRRIELMNIRLENRVLFIKHGLCGFADEKVCGVWYDKLNGPRKRLNKNCRFYFTERGWDAFGRLIISTCKTVGQEFRIITVKEKSVDPMYKDEWQVAVRPRKARQVRRLVTKK